MTPKQAAFKAMEECSQCLKLLDIDELPALAFTDEGHLRVGWQNGDDGLIIYFFGDGEAVYGISAEGKTYTSTAVTFKVNDMPDDLRRAASALQLAKDSRDE